jgi:hypothetical protein
MIGKYRSPNSAGQEEETGASVFFGFSSREGELKGDRKIRAT